MASGSTCHRTNSNSSLLVWACFVLLSLNAFAFIVFAVAPHIQADVFRHLREIVLPFLDGREGLSILWSNHHPAPLLHLIQIANLKFLGFRLDYEAYLGFFFQILTTFIILKSIISMSDFGNRDTRIVGIAGMILIACISFGFNSRAQYTWPLLATVQYLYFFGIVVFLSVDKCVQVESWTRHLIIAAASMAFMFANSDYGTIFLASIIATTTLAYLLDRRAVYLRATLVLAAAWIVYRLFMLTILPDAGHSLNVMAILEFLVRNSPRIFMQFSIALSAGLVDLAFLKRTFPGAESFLIGVSLLVTLLFIVTFITYFRYRLFRVSAIPAALMLVSIFFSAPTVIFRQAFLGNDIWSLAVPRYVPTFKLAIIGMLWALWLILRERSSVRGKSLKWHYSSIAVASIATVLFIQGAQIHAGWKTAAYLRSNAENHALGVFLAGKTLENNIELPREIVKGNKDYQEILTYLEKNRLNVFSDNFPDSRLLDQHVTSRRMFYTSDIKILIGDEHQEHGEILAKTGDIEASWEMRPQGITIDRKSGKPLYVRVEIVAGSSRVLKNSLVVEPGNGPVSRINLYKGRQSLFFTVEKGRRLNIKVPPPNKIEAMELRM